MIKYKIDHDYGIANMYSKVEVADPLDLFYNLANQCFGIRKSIGDTKLISAEAIGEMPDYVITPTCDLVSRHPEIYGNPMQQMITNAGQGVRKKFKPRKNTFYILCHSGGDLIMFTKGLKKQPDNDE